jgi:hypothetical protein
MDTRKIHSTKYVTKILSRSFLSFSCLDAPPWSWTTFGHARYKQEDQNDADSVPSQRKSQ